MQETDEQRRLRRAISKQLTARINDAARFPGIRDAVIAALAALDRRLRELTDRFREDHLLRIDTPLAQFYIKGGNAFEAWMTHLQHPQQALYSSGSSDWDTQIVVDPWLPQPLQELLYGKIEEIVLDELRSAGIEVATAAGLVDPAISPLTPSVFVDDNNGMDGTYFLKRDEPQTLRKVYDRDRIGLWMDDRRKLSDEQTPFPELIPGIMLNDAIRPFRLYRLGYTWHAQWVDVEGGAPGEPLEVRRPALMELIDVTLPRRDTIEAVAVWAELQEDRLSVTYTRGPGEPYALPLPDLYYHLHENITMLAEIADGTSHHADKEQTRRTRFGLILTYCRNNGQTQRFMDTLASMAGQRIGNPNDDANALVDGLMAAIRQRTVNAPPDFVDGRVRDETRKRIVAARDPMRAMIELMRAAAPDLGPLSAAFSDDLVLMDFLAWNPYIALDKMKFSGVDMAAVVRVSHQQFLAIHAEALQGLLRQQAQAFGQPPQAITVHALSHNTARPGGVTYEQTLVVFYGEKAAAMITLTTATAEESPFRPDVQTPGVDYCSLVELAGQRKAAAALIEDYVVRTAFSTQYGVLKELLPGV